MYIAGSEFTASLDKYCIETLGIPEVILMENAASNASQKILELEEFQKVLILAGGGNNGGDGFVIARKLHNVGKDVGILFLGSREKLGEAAGLNHDIAKNLGIDFVEEDVELRYDTVVDCLFGAGLNREVGGRYRDLIERVNKEHGNYSIFSVDLPSGINGSSGEVMGISIDADYTLTFEFFKKGFLRLEAANHLGEVHVLDIGIPRTVYNNWADLPSFIDEDYVLDNLIIKDEFSHKGNFGRTAIFAGANGFYGAASICTKACVAMGAGLTTLVCDEEVQRVASIKLDEAMTCKYTDVKRWSKILEAIDAIAFGPGMGANEITKNRLKDLIEKTNKPIVVDADGINVFDTDILTPESKVVITPHMGEFSRLINVPIDEIEKDRIRYASEYAQKNNLVIVLKGRYSVVSDGYRTMVNTTGNPAMANGGMGDALTGIITSLCGQGYDIFVAAALGVFIHGLAADMVYKEKQVVIASDVIKELPYTLKSLYNKI